MIALARPLQLLLVDDDQVFWEMVREGLADDPTLAGAVAIRFFGDGEDALAYLAQAGQEGAEAYPWPDVILLDQRMPRLDGTALLRQLRKDPRMCRVPVCLFSTSGQDKLVREAYEVGANFCILKPIDFDELKDRLRRIIDFFREVVELPAPG